MWNGSSLTQKKYNLKTSKAPVLGKLAKSEHKRPHLFTLKPLYDTNREKDKPNLENHAWK